jgi:mannose-1-phosphate guanylyltransferase/mannose-1-phosphate guanylyltransferase/phosphomannomutase
MTAGLGTRLRPLTYEVPKPVVPVANRPVIEHILRLLASHGFTEVICNLHWFPEVIRSALGDGSAFGVELSYVFEEELLGTAGGVRNVRDFFGDEPFLVMAGDALTDVDLRALGDDHEASDGIATLVAKRVSDTSEYGVIVTDAEARVQGFQEKPDPAEALSDRANSMIYAFDPEVFDYFPEAPVIDFALDVFPALLDSGVPFHVHETNAYWNDIGTVAEYLQGNLDVLSGLVTVEAAGEMLDAYGEEDAPVEQPGGWSASGRVLLGEGAEIGAGAIVNGPAVIGPGARVGSEAAIKESVLLPGAEVPGGSFLVGSIAGRRGGLATPPR